MTTPLVGVGDFTGTVSPVPADVLMDVQSLQVLTPDQTVTYGPYAMTQPSYSVAVDGLVNAASINGLFTVTMRWTDPVTSFLVDQERWHISGTTSSPAANNGLVIGRGPSKSAQLSIIVHNNDAANNMTLDLIVWQSSRVVTRDDWRGFQESGSVPVWSVGSREPNSNILGYENAINVSAGVTRQRLCALYSGQGMLSVALAAGNTATVTVIVPLADVGVAAYPVIFAAAPGATLVNAYLSLPRCPVVVQIANAGAGAVVVTWSLIMQEFAS